MVTKSPTGVLPSGTFSKMSEPLPPRQCGPVQSQLTLRQPWNLVDTKVSLAKIIGLNITNCSALSATTPLKRLREIHDARWSHSAGFETSDGDPHDG